MDGDGGDTLTETGSGAVDYWCNMFTPDRQALWEETVAAQGLALKIRDGSDDAFCEPAAMVRRMDEVGVDTLLIPTCPPHLGDSHLDFSQIAAGSPTEVEALALGHPGRFVGTWSIDPALGMAGVHAARAALEQPWIVALHLHTHSFDRAFDHADLYPYYALAADADVPVMMQAGTSGGLMPSECGRPIGIDRAAIYFPEVSFVLSHLGWPWTEEAIAMALKFPNVYLGSAVYPVKHWPDAIRSFLRGPGKRKMLYGTGFPTTGHRHTLAQLAELDLPPTVLADYLGGTARRIFGRLPSDDPSRDQGRVSSNG